MWLLRCVVFLGLLLSNDVVHSRLYSARDKVFGVPNMQHYVVICARVGPGDGPYLDEWVAYHLAAGVDHLFLGVDPAADAVTKRATRRWLASKYVTRMRWNKTFIDQRVFEPTFSTSFMARCYDVVGSRTRWMALIDTDEFIVPRGCSIPEAIAQFCHPLIPWVPVVWSMFGSSHRDDRRCVANLVVEDFTMSGGNCSHLCPPQAGQFYPYCGECRHTKAVVNTFCARTARHADNHWVNRLDEMPAECLQAIGTTRKAMAAQPSNSMLEGQADVGQAVVQCGSALQLHHFGTLSRAEFFTKRSKRRRDADIDLQALWTTRDLNHAEQPEAQKFSKAVRQLLALGTTAPPVRRPQCPAPQAVLGAARVGRWRSLELEAAATLGLPPVDSQPSG
eukprot:EG_transcript_8963